MRVATSGMTKCYSTIPRGTSLSPCEGFFVRTLPETAYSHPTICQMSSPKMHARSQQTGETWTRRRLLKWMAEHFQNKQIDSPRVVAEMLLAHVLGCERMKLYMEADRPASTVELTTLRELVAGA